MDVDLTTVLGRLLTDPSLRADFSRDPQEVAHQLNLRIEDVLVLISMSADQLERQADVLINKRFSQVQSLLPRTFENLGPVALEIFRRFATASWPTGPNRHLIDAKSFCEFLGRSSPGHLNTAEAYRIRAQLTSGPVSAAFARDAWINGRKRPALLIFIRRRSGNMTTFRLFLSL